MICDVCQQEEAGLLLGNLQNGDQTAFCVADFARFGLDTAIQLLPREEILKVVGAKPTAPVRLPADGPDGNGGRKRGRKAEPAPEPEPESASGEPETPAAPADE